MNLPLVFEPEAGAEIDDAYVWINRLREGWGGEFMTEIERVLHRFQENPELHAVVYRNVRCALVRRFSHAVYYRIEPERIVVIAVHHSKRDPKRWQSRA